MPLTSCLYECKIGHKRWLPRKHSFAHSHFMFYLDLDEMEVLASRLKLFGTGSKRRLGYWFDQGDYIPDGSFVVRAMHGIAPTTASARTPVPTPVPASARTPVPASDPTGVPADAPAHANEGCLALKERVINFCAENGIRQAVHKVRLLTNVRFWGYVFNPVSFFFCFDKEEKPLCCVAEIGNTFGEKKLYFIAAEGESFQARRTKLFYISPFTELNHDLIFDLALPSKSLALKIHTYDGGQPVVTTYLRGHRTLISDWNLLVLTLSYPFAPMRVIALIHLHALLLWLKRVPHHRKEENREQQIAVINPHKSLQKPQGSNHVNAS